MNLPLILKKYNLKYISFLANKYQNELKLKYAGKPNRYP